MMVCASGLTSQAAMTGPINTGAGLACSSGSDMKHSVQQGVASSTKGNDSRERRFSEYFHYGLSTLEEMPCRHRTYIK
ncbi:hypothetical protein BgiBS90_016795, partial [Biomphalaria glabrata]